MKRKIVAAAFTLSLVTLGLWPSAVLAGGPPSSIAVIPGQGAVHDSLRSDDVPPPEITVFTPQGTVALVAGEIVSRPGQP